jgi:sugar phosphate permease
VTGPAPGTDFKAWRVKIFASTWVAYAGLYFCRKAFYVVKGDLETDQGFDPVTLGQIGTAYLVAYTVGQFVSAGLGSRTGPRVLLLAGLAISTGCNVVFGFANSPWTFGAFMVVNGLAQATGWPGCIGTLAQWTRRKERGTLLGFWSTCYQIGGVMANAWAAFWLDSIGWRGAFLMASCVTLGAWMVVLLLQRNAPEDVGLERLSDPGESGPETSRPAGETAPSWNRNLTVTVLLVGVFYFGVKFVRYALWSWTPYLLQRNFGLASDEAGYLSTVFDIGGFAGVIAAGFVSDRVFSGRRSKVAFVMVVGMMLATGMLVVVGAAGVVRFAVTLAVVGFMLYGPDALLTGAGAIDVGSRRAALAAAGVINGMGSAGSVLQETVVARAIETNPGQVAPVFALLLAASVLAVAALAVVLVRNRRGLSDL